MTQSEAGGERWGLRLFGGFELCLRPGGENVSISGKRERVLLAYLASRPNGRQGRRKLATLLWGDATDETALDNLRTCVWGLRKALGDAKHRIIASEGEDIVLDLAPFEIDTVSFRRLATRPNAEELEQAASLYSGDFLDGLDIGNEEFEFWRREELARFKEEAIDVLSRLMAQRASVGERDRAIEAGLRLLRLEPLHETALRQLMRFYTESGRRSAAIQLYRALGDTLRKDLDAQPEAETCALYAQIMRGEAEPNVAAGLDAADPRAKPEATPDRLEDAPRDRSKQVEPPRTLPVRALPKLRVLALAVASSLALAIVVFLAYQFIPALKPASVQSARIASVSQANAISIAVLPFANLSGDANQEFFSDGMTEEISSAIAKIPDLRMVGRSSALQFKGENKDLRAIGKALGATHIIEGSVRKEGTRVRISAELVQADNGLQVWSENYDRELTDIFAVQEGIATAIAGALRIPLGLQPGKTLITSRLADPKIYEQYLQLRSRTFPAKLDEMIAFVARAPAFAPGWAALAGEYRGGAAVASRSGDFKMDSLLTDKEEAAARKAIELDPGYAGGYSELAGAQTRRGKWAEAEDLYKQALSIDPNDSNFLHIYSQTLATVGRLKEALRMRERLRALEPLLPAYNQITARIMLANGQTDASIAILEPDPSTGARRNVYLAEAYAIKGRFADAADALLRITSEIDRSSVEDAARLLRSAPNKANPSAKSPPLVAELGFVYAYTGAPERVLEYPEKAVKEGNLITVQLVWQQSAAPLRKTERFKALVRSAGLVDYWRARGWPDLCHPVGTDDFACG